MEIVPLSVYSLAAEYADLVRATFMVESNETLNPPMGDGGQASGPGQIHPAFFKEYYGRSKRFPAQVSDTWLTAWVKAIASYYDIWHDSVPRDLLIQGYRLGLGAVLQDGKRDPVRLERFSKALNQIRAKSPNPNDHQG